MVTAHNFFGLCSLETLLLGLLYSLCVMIARGDTLYRLTDASVHVHVKHRGE